MISSALAVCLLTAAPALASQEGIDPDLSGTARLAAILARVGEVQAATKTLEANFEQRKSSRLLAQPSVSTGRFYFEAPDRVLWKFEDPRPMTVLISGGVAITFRPAEKRAERVEVGRVLRRVLRFLGAAEPLDALRQHFEFVLRDPGESGDYTLILRPTSSQLRKRLEKVEVVIDRTRFIAVAVSYSEPDGDTTAYTFTDTVANEPLDPGLFSVDLPPDVEVVEVKLSSGE